MRYVASAAPAMVVRTRTSLRVDRADSQPPTRSTSHSLMPRRSWGTARGKRPRQGSYDEVGEVGAGTDEQHQGDPGQRLAPQHDDRTRVGVEGGPAGGRRGSEVEDGVGQSGRRVRVVRLVPTAETPAGADG